MDKRENTIRAELTVGAQWSSESINNVDLTMPGQFLDSDSVGVASQWCKGFRRLSLELRCRVDCAVLSSLIRSVMSCNDDLYLYVERHHSKSKKSNTITKLLQLFPAVGLPSGNTLGGAALQRK